ncbi:hypothetical protein PCC6912_20140 [Chlorogloeopsis fritschii PCC 6912]|uniref:Uncharacterized protein n=1 Tax=Chlorogloeopsis fritschii PCC 6912 TaxID=211165 RepID=A0A433NLG0_CHLFR|nr:hypothetical protein PCC6912_20140 [Chlorogloeopsis fritschii PCC 6912]
MPRSYHHPIQYKLMYWFIITKVENNQTQFINTKATISSKSTQPFFKRDGFASGDE